MLKERVLRPLLTFLRRVFFNFNFNIVKIYFQKSEFDNFLQRIYPVTTEHELIRIGPDMDSGYLIPNDLEGISVCFSPVVDVKSTFELRLFDTYNIKSYLCDYSVDAPPITSQGFSFLKKYLNSYENEVNITLENWVDSVGEDSDLLLQMDIEGGEYDVITLTDSDFFKKFRIMVIEFHDLDQLFTSSGFRSISSVFDKLLKNFMIVHVHPNNRVKEFKYKSYTIPPLIEFTFLRKDRIKEYQHTQKFPHPLDMDNVKKMKPMELPKIFYKG